jgi:hypothetical protein
VSDRENDMTIGSTDSTIEVQRPDFARALMKPSGRVVHDERGNAEWQWSESGVRKSVHLAPALLSVLDAPTTVEPLKPGAGVDGYDPYGRTVATRKKPAVKRTDLRELSRQIEQARKAGRKLHDT